MKLDVGENARPQTAPSGLVYLQRSDRSYRRLRTYLDTTSRVSVVQTRICGPAAEARYLPFGDHAISLTICLCPSFEKVACLAHPSRFIIPISAIQGKVWNSARGEAVYCVPFVRVGTAKQDPEGCQTA